MDPVLPTSQTRDSDRSPQRGESGLLAGSRRRASRGAAQSLERRRDDPVERRRVERVEEERERRVPDRLKVRFRRARSEGPGGPLAHVRGQPEAVKPPVIYDGRGRVRPLEEPGGRLDRRA